MAPAPDSPWRNRTYAQWMDAVDRAVDRRAGLSLYDLADTCTRDQWADGMRPAEAAREALTADGFYDDE